VDAGQWCLVESELSCRFLVSGTVTVQSVPSLPLLQLNFKLEPSCWIPFSSIFFLHPFPTLLISRSFVGWICCLCYVLQPLTDFRFPEGWFFFFLRILFGPHLLSLLRLLLRLQEEGRGPRSHLTAQCQLGCAAAARGRVLLRSTAFWAVSRWSYAVLACLLWQGGRVFPSENSATVQSSDVAV